MADGTVLEAVWSVIVGGNSADKHFNPILESIDIFDRTGDTSDEAQIVLADVGGRLLLPASGDPVEIQLGWKSTGAATVFTGVADDPRSRGSRGGGRKLIVHAHGFDTQGKAKEPLEFHKDDASLQDFMGEAAGKAGLSFQAQGDIAGIQREYWVAATESFINLGNRIAREVGATFKIVGTQAFMWPLNSPLSSVGGSSDVVAKWGDGTLIDWDISPRLARPQYQEARERWYDVKDGKWNEVKITIEEVHDAIYSGRLWRPDQNEAQHSATSHSRRSKREAGSGYVVMRGEPRARAEGNVIVQGARPGIDGTYRIEVAHHHYSRAQGFVSKLTVKEPQGDAGDDDRDDD